MVNALAKEEPFWEPGTRNGYHALTIGWLVGELVRRISGKSLGTFFQDEVAKPLGLDFWIGLPEDKEPRVAPMIAAEPDPESLFLERSQLWIPPIACLTWRGHGRCARNMTPVRLMPRRLPLAASPTAGLAGMWAGSPAVERPGRGVGESRRCRSHGPRLLRLDGRRACDPGGLLWDS
jgi:CubicO group peptidase (beta-lactamase class C family)